MDSSGSLPSHSGTAAFSWPGKSIVAVRSDGAEPFTSCYCGFIPSLLCTFRPQRQTSREQFPNNTTSTTPSCGRKSGHIGTNKYNNNLIQGEESKEVKKILESM